MRAPRGALPLRVAGALMIGALAANCSGPPQQTSSVDLKYGVEPSPRVVEDGELVPKGGGRAMVGKPYMIAGQIYTPVVDPSYSDVGQASWYGDAFHGRRTANGEVFDKESIAAAHPTLPLPSYVRVTNLSNRHSMVVRVNDRGPYHANRLIDVSQRVAEALDFKHYGTTRVKVEYLREASIMGSDDRKLMATLRSDGTPARLPSGSLLPVMVAAAAAAPLPPQRPFDLGGARGARVPLALGVSADGPDSRQGRVVAASLHYAAHGTVRDAALGDTSRFVSGPFADVKQQRFVRLSAATAP
jgi:rare lipoprotein A